MKENPLRKPHAMGQPSWFDYIRRDLISRANGAFANMKPTVEACCVRCRTDVGSMSA